MTETAARHGALGTGPTSPPARVAVVGVHGYGAAHVLRAQELQRAGRVRLVGLVDPVDGPIVRDGTRVEGDLPAILPTVDDLFDGFARPVDEVGEAPDERRQPEPGHRGHDHRTHPGVCGVVSLVGVDRGSFGGRRGLTGVGLEGGDGLRFGEVGAGAHQHPGSGDEVGTVPLELLQEHPLLFGGRQLARTTADRRSRPFGVAPPSSHAISPAQCGLVDMDCCWCRPRQRA